MTPLRNYSWACVLLLLSAAMVGNASARDWDKDGLYNTFYLESPTGMYELTITKGRTYSLKPPRGKAVTGEIWASGEEIGFFEGTTNRHFSFGIENGDLVLTPTKKDGPDATTTLGRMPPQGRGTQAVFTAIQNFNNRRVVVQPPPVVVAPPPPAWQQPVQQPPVWQEPVRQPPVWQPVEPAGPAVNWDGDKKSLYNTFYLETPTGIYELTISRDRSFRLQHGRRNVTTGQIWASDDEVGFIQNGVNRHFAYAFDNGNLVLRPTKKDAPDANNLLGMMPPQGRGTTATFVAFQNRGAIQQPVVVQPPVIVAPPPVVVRPRGHYEQRSEFVEVEPERIEQKYIPARTETRRDVYNRPYTIEVEPARYEQVKIPARYEQRTKEVWVQD